MADGWEWEDIPKGTVLRSSGGTLWTFERRDTTTWGAHPFWLFRSAAGATRHLSVYQFMNWEIVK